MRYILIILLGVLLFSCSDSKVPRDLIQEDQLHDLLVEIHFLDAIGTDHSLNLITGDIDSLTLYNSLLHMHIVIIVHYNIKLTLFVKTIVYI